MSSKNTILNLAISQARQSNCIHKLGSVLTKGNKILYRGYNNNMRTKFQHTINCCLHAEMSVINQFINIYVRPKRYKLSH